MTSETIHEILQSRGSPFAPEIAKQAYLRDSTERAIKLVEDRGGVVDDTDSCKVYRTQDAIFFYFDVTREAHSIGVHGLTATLRDVLDGTDWKICHHSPDHLPDSVNNFIDDRRSYPGE